MSTNKEIVQGLYEAFGRGDVPAIIERMADDVVLHTQGNVGPYEKTYRGKDGVGALMQAIGEHEEIGKMDTYLFVAEGEYVVTFINCSTKAKKTGKSADVHFIHRWKLHEGKAVEMVESIDSLAYSKIWE